VAFGEAKGVYIKCVTKYVTDGRVILIDTDHVALGIQGQMILECDTDVFRPFHNSNVGKRGFGYEWEAQWNLTGIERSGPDKSHVWYVLKVKPIYPQLLGNKPLWQ
jgi:hypothetical protein